MCYLLKFDIQSTNLFFVMLREECGRCCLCALGGRRRGHVVPNLNENNFLSGRSALYKMFQSECALSLIL